MYGPLSQGEQLFWGLLLLAVVLSLVYLGTRRQK